MSVNYNVKYKYKNGEFKSLEEMKNIFNKKLFNIIMILESQELFLLKQ